MSYYPEIRRFGLAAVVIMALSFAPPPVAAAPFSLTGWIVDSNSKELIKLGNLGRTPPTTTVAAINDAGQVVGQSYTTHPFYPQRAFTTGPNGAGMTAIALDGDHSSASDINNSGQVTGLFGTVAGKTSPFLTGPNGVGIRDLSTVLGDRSYPVGINDAGRLAGNTLVLSSLTNRAFITGPNGVGKTDLGTLGGSESTALDINNAGQVVGGSTTALGEHHAFITGPNGAGMTDLGPLLGDASIALAVNNIGQVVGSFHDAASGEEHAFITGPNGVGMRDIGMGCPLASMTSDRWWDISTTRLQVNTMLLSPVPMGRV